MDIKKIVFAMFLIGVSPFRLIAQDDMYFTPKKGDAGKVVQHDMPVPQYSAPAMDIDEYNRHYRTAGVRPDVDLDTLYSDVVPLDTIGADAAESAGGGRDYYAYNPDDDYACSRCLGRYDGYYWCDPWYYGYYGDPYWAAGGWWYGPWYDPWYYGWYRPWGFYHSWYWPVSYYRPYRGITGTMNHGRAYGYRGGVGGNANFRGNRGGGDRTFTVRRYDRNDNGTTYDRYRGNRQNQNYNRQNNQNRPSFNSNSSFGGNRGAGSFRGGGSFGGSRGAGGGGGFRGRR